MGTKGGYLFLFCFLFICSAGISQRKQLPFYGRFNIVAESSFSLYTYEFRGLFQVKTGIAVRLKKKESYTIGAFVCFRPLYNSRGVEVFFSHKLRSKMHLIYSAAYMPSEFAYFRFPFVSTGPTFLNKYKFAQMTIAAEFRLLKSKVFDIHYIGGVGVSGIFEDKYAWFDEPFVKKGLLFSPVFTNSIRVALKMGK